MKERRAVAMSLLLLYCGLVSLLFVGGSAAAEGRGFSVLTDNNFLLAFDNLEALKNFSASRTLSLPLEGNPVSAAANGYGDFVVLSASSVVVLDSTGQFQQATTFSGYTFSDVAFSQRTAVALGVSTTGLIALSSSTNGGNTWEAPSTDAINQRSTSGTGSIAFASDGGGVVGFGGYIATSTDGGSTWTVPQTSIQKSYTKVAVFNQSLSVGSGSYSLTGTTFLDSSKNGWQSITEAQLPSLNPPRASISGFSFINSQKWSFATTGGEIWQTNDGANTWNRIANVTGVAWHDLIYNPDFDVYLAVGEYNLQGRSGVIAYSADGGATWLLSNPIQLASRFIRALPYTPSTPAPPPSVSPSPSRSPSPSPSELPLPSASPSASPSPSELPPPSASPSVSPSPSKLPPPSATPSTSFSPSPSPSKHTASPTPSASPSKHTASPTPSASPSRATQSPTPSKGSPSPSPSPAKKNDDSKLPLILGLSLGLGGGAALISGVAVVYFYRRFSSASAARYRPININTDV